MTIPPEIVDRVIDFAHNDFKTLVACSLVARDWVPSAYLHLFTKLRVLTAGDDARLKELTNSSPNLLRYCQELTLGGIYGEVGSTLGFLTFVKPLLTHPKRIDGFTSLHTLHIREFSSPPTDFIEFLVAISHKITTISIAECSFESRDDLWKVLRIFPNLQNVHTSRLGYSSSEEGELTVPPDCCHSPPIASFSVCTHCMGFVLQDLAGPPYPLTHLKSLEIHHTDQYQEKLNHVANKYRDVITTLKFGATSSIGCDIPPHIGIYNRLQTLILGKLELFAAYPSSHRSNTTVISFSWVNSAMEQISSRLTRLSFEIAVTERRDLNAIYWEDIDELLDSHEQFEDLKSVDVVFLDTIPTKLPWQPDTLRPGVDLREEMTKRMRRTTKRGLMRCSNRALRT